MIRKTTVTVKIMTDKTGKYCEEFNDSLCPHLLKIISGECGFFGALNICLRVNRWKRHKRCVAGEVK